MSGAAHPDRAIDAAALIVLRDVPGGVEVLLGRRAATLAFAGGALVFPGGRVDPEDHARAASYPMLANGAHRIAALRETREEVGIDLAGADASAALDALAPFARWRPPPGLNRRFDTRFFIAEATTSAIPRPDGREIEWAGWSRPADAIDAVASGTEQALFPTLCLLHRLTRSASVMAVRDDARRHPPRLIVPQLVQRADGGWLTIPTEIGYPVTALPVAGARRD